MTKTPYHKISIALAPMYGVTDFPMRLWFSLISGCSEMTTPFLRVTETYPHKEPYEWAPELFDEEIKNSLSFTTIPQLMASCPKRFVAAYEMIKDSSATVEINCGCPSPKVVGHGAGSSLLRDVGLFKEFITYIADNISSENFCVKIRTGYDNSDNFYDLIKAIKDLNLKKLTIHGRTKEQKYSSYARWDLIAKASELCPYPVYASGDVVDLASYKKSLVEMPHIQGLIIGRGALQRPWLFHELESGKELELDKKALYHSLICYGLLLELNFKDSKSLRNLIYEGNFNKAYIFNLEKWVSLQAKLEALVFTETHKISDFSKISLGRMKLIIGYLIKGVLKGSEGKKVLRSRSYLEFTRELESFLS